MHGPIGVIGICIMVPLCLRMRRSDLFSKAELESVLARTRDRFYMKSVWSFIAVLD